MPVSTGVPAPRPVVWAAWATPLCVLPSALWRLWALTQVPDHCPGGVGVDVYVVFLSLVSATAALLTIGLVSDWGRRLPGWVPVVGGRPINPTGVLVAACIGLALIWTVYGYAALNPVFHWRAPNDSVPGCPPPDQTELAWIAYLAYAPILAWGPLLAIVTADFYRRVRLERQRRREPSTGP